MAALGWLFNRRVLLNLAGATCVFVIFYVGNLGYQISLRDVQYFNGWVLVVAMAGLLLLTVRKKVVILPFGRVRWWLQLHYYLGLLTVGVFAVHNRYRLPDAPLEWILWSLFVLVSLTGILGAVLSKVIPHRFEAHGERILFERIPTFRSQLAGQVEELVTRSIKHDNTSSIADLYNNKLAEYFSRPRHLVAHLMSSKLPLTRLNGELDAIARYLDDRGRAHLDELRALVAAKDNLDFQRANGGLLKLWMFIHIPATYALIAAIIVHVLLVYAFSTGIA